MLAFRFAKKDVNKKHKWNKLKKGYLIKDNLFVGVAGFEPAASCSQSRRDNRATLHPVIGCKYKVKFFFSKQIVEINFIYFNIVI